MSDWIRAVTVGGAAGGGVLVVIIVIIVVVVVAVLFKRRHSSFSKSNGTGAHNEAVDLELKNKPHFNNSQETLENPYTVCY